MADAQRLALDAHDDFDDPLLNQREIPADSRVSPQTLGQDLCNARERNGITPEVIWRDLKIAPHHLTAIENSCFDALPGRVYAVGFVRSYARYLGLDVEKCLARLKTEMAGTDAKPAFVRPPVSFERKNALNDASDEIVTGSDCEVGLFSPRERVEISAERGVQQYVVVGMIIAVLVYGGYNIFSSSRLMAPSSIMPVPARLADEAGLTPKKTRAPKIAMRQETAQVARTVAPAALQTASSQPAPAQSLASVEPTTALLPETNRVPTTKPDPTHSVSPAPLASIAPTTALLPDPNYGPSTKSAPTHALSVAPTASIEPTAAPLPKSNYGPAAKSVPTDRVVVAPLASIEPAHAQPGEPAAIASTDGVPPKQPAPDVSVTKPGFRPPLPLGPRYGTENTNSRVILRLHRSIRVAVKGSRNHIFIDRKLGAGATYRVPNTPGVKLNAPDAGAVEVILDGNTVGFAGKNGVAAKGLGLDPPSIIRRYHWQ
jgi:cytoskeleton protein RodZ